MLVVDSAIPCRSVENSDFETVMDKHTNVELDPASEVEMRELVDEQHLRVVGWYHSHPTFVPNPSLIDLVNQKNYQAFFRSNEMEEIVTGMTAEGLDEEKTKAAIVSEPFVGVIVGICFRIWFISCLGPYDPNLPKSVSAVNWFNVGNRDEDMNRPKHLDIFQEETSISGFQEDEIVKMVFLCLKLIQ